jgi:hypothetical protein
MTKDPKVHLKLLCICSSKIPTLAYLNEMKLRTKFPPHLTPIQSASATDHAKTSNSTMMNTLMMTPSTSRNKPNITAYSTRRRSSTASGEFSHQILQELAGSLRAMHGFSTVCFSKQEKIKFEGTWWLNCSLGDL